MSVSSTYVGGLSISVFSVHVWHVHDLCTCLHTHVWVGVSLCMCLPYLCIYVEDCVSISMCVSLCTYTCVDICMCLGVTVCSCLCLPCCVSSLYLSLRLDFLGSD